MNGLKFWSLTSAPGRAAIKSPQLPGGWLPKSGRSMGKHLKWIWIVLFLFGTSPDSNAEETIRLTTGEFPPYVSKQLKYYGPGPRIVTEAFALEGIKVEFEFFPWARAYKAAKEGNYDGSSHWAKNPDRQKHFYFSNAMWKEKWVFFHKKNYAFDWGTLDDLKRISIGGTLEYTYTTAFYAAEKAGKIKIDWVPNDVQNLKKLSVGRVQIFPLEINVGFELLHKNFKPKEIKFFTYHPKPLKVDASYLLLSKKIEKNKQRLVLFNRGLKRLKESGKIDQYFKESREGKYRK